MSSDGESEASSDRPTPTTENYPPAAPPKPHKKNGHQKSPTPEAVPSQLHQQYVQHPSYPPQYLGPMPQIQRPNPHNSVPYHNNSVVPIQPPLPPPNLQLWSTHLFECAQDPGNCLETAFCPCITFGRIANIADQGMTACVSDALIYQLLMMLGCHWVYSFMYRNKLRAQYSLVEDPCPDCLVHAFCEPCALCQEYRELQNSGFNMSIGYAQNIIIRNQRAAAESAPRPAPPMTK